MQTHIQLLRCGLPIYMLRVAHTKTLMSDIHGDLKIFAYIQIDRNQSKPVTHLK